MEKSIKVGGNEYKIRELTIEEGLDFSQETDPKMKTFEFVVKCVEPKMTIEQFKKLSFKEGLAIINEVNEINGLSDFQKPVKEN